ncbi:uncharacterized protein LOC131149875 [Malania oleifera]|uniref:uncharacterized protein LOC131149875 n=1 Tax=Malania oleifera TaxID=397392 RepID=UPI0025ADBCB5|nr:uncharacterized protein LOC131149875 [Malania oleifera]
MTAAEVTPQTASKVDVDQPFNTTMKKPGRRVSFSENPPKHRRSASDEDEERRPRHCRLNCCVCCCWVWLVGVGVGLLLVLGGALFFSFLKSALPTIRIIGATVPTLNVINSTSTTTTASLYADVNLVMEASNDNARVGVEVGGMRVRVLWAERVGVELGGAEVGWPRLLAPGKSGEVKVGTKVRKGAVDREDGAGLKSDWAKGEMELEVVGRGTIGFWVGGNRIMGGWPLAVACHNVSVAMVNAGRWGNCTLNLISIRDLYDGREGRVLLDGQRP